MKKALAATARKWGMNKSDVSNHSAASSVDELAAVLRGGVHEEEDEHPSKIFGLVICLCVRAVVAHLFARDVAKSIKRDIDFFGKEYKKCLPTKMNVEVFLQIVHDCLVPRCLQVW